MAIPTIRSWTFKEKGTFAKMNEIRDALRFVLGGGATGKPICKVTSTVAQTLVNNTATALVWNSALKDPRGMWASTPNPTRITVPETGSYTFGCICEFQASATGQRELYLRINGTVNDGGVRRGALSANLEDLEVTNLLNLNAGDYVEAWVLQNSGGPLDTGLSYFNPKFWCVFESA